MKNIIRIGELESSYISQVLGTGFSGSKGVNMVGRLEEKFAERFGTKFAIAQINGTATLHAALIASGVKPGDEVIVPPLTMASTAMAVLQADAVPIFADVEEDTYQIDPKCIETLITSRTRAIMTVALYGLSPDMDPIMELAKRHGLVVIEDNAECFLAYYKNRLVGTIGDLSSFSFQSSKHMTSGEGGIVLTNNGEYADAVRRFGVLGYASVSRKNGLVTKNDIQNPDYDRHISLGYNYRMSELCAAVSLGQLERLDELVRRRIDSATLFEQAIDNCKWLIPQFTPSDRTNSYWALAVRIVHPVISWQMFRNKFMELGGDGIYAAWKLSYQEPMFQNMNFMGKKSVIEATYGGRLQNWSPGLCPVAEKLQRQILAFKTNYWDWNRALEQAEILRKTIKYFDQMIVS